MITPTAHRTKSLVGKPRMNSPPVVGAGPCARPFWGEVRIALPHAAIPQTPNTRYTTPIKNGTHNPITSQQRPANNIQGSHRRGESNVSARKVNIKPPNIPERASERCGKPYNK